MNPPHDIPVEGFNPADPGVSMLARAVDHRTPALLVHCGPLPGVGRGATRLVLDVRERSVHGERCVAARLPATLRSREPESGDASGEMAEEMSGEMAREMSGEMAGEMAEDVLGDDPLAEQRWPLALVWPRAHLGKDFSEQCLAVAATHLSPGGRLLCAVRKARGGASLKRVMEALLGNVRVIARDRGYHLHASEHAGQLNLELARELIERRYAWRDPLLGDIELLGVPGVFSRKHLDVGTAALLRHLEYQDGALPQTPARVLDLGCGLGALSLWAARRWPSTRVLALETNVLAASLTRVNAARAGVEARVAVLNQDALEEPALERSFVGDCELALVNPPTHANAEVFSALVATPRRYLRPGSPAWFVVNRVGALRKALARSEASIDAHVEAPGFHLVRARWG